MTANAHVLDVTDDTFATEVLERSRTVPVVVDFWAPWCGPCRVLGPLIEREVQALGGRVVLAKVDTDKNPRLAQQFQIMSIPAVKAFRDGQVVDEFMGALPAAAIKEFLGRLAPSEGAQALEKARAAYAARTPEAEAALRALLTVDEAKDEGAFRLAHLCVETGRAAEARALAATVSGRSPFADRIEALERLIELVEAAGDEAAASAAVAAAPGDPEARWALAATHAKAGRYGAAMEELLESVSRKPRHADGRARKALLAVFDHLEEPGRDADLAREYRRRLQIVS